MRDRSNEQRARAEGLDLEAEIVEFERRLLREEREDGRDLDHCRFEQRLALGALPFLALLDLFEAGSFVAGVLVEEPEVAVERRHDVRVAKLAEDDRLAASRGVPKPWPPSAAGDDSHHLGLDGGALSPPPSPS